MRIAIIGATGLVGSTMLRILEERSFPADEIIPVASSRSLGMSVSWQGKEIAVCSVEDAMARKPHLALFSAGGGPSKELAPQFVEKGIRVIDNSSAWRMDPDKKLVVPEVNGHVLTKDDYIIANPNCSTIQLVMVLKPLHDRYHIQRVVVSTYQSVTGTGQKAADQLLRERSGDKSLSVYPHPIDMNLLPHIDVFGEDGSTKEEVKMRQETAKIMGDDTIRVSATCVRVPVMGGHSESVNIQFKEDFDLQEVRSLLAQMPGVVVQDDPAANIYPMPLEAAGQDAVFVGRLRRDASQPHTLNCWIVADNLRKGAATNAVQIAETLLQKGFV